MALSAARAWGRSCWIGAGLFWMCTGVKPMDEINRGGMANRTSVTYPGPSTTSYAFDAFGNRTRMTVAGNTATYAYDDAGNAIYDEVGELVCAQPIPSMPLHFWGDTDGRRYFESYFDVYPGVWRHGDWLKLITRPESVTAVIYGRSDSTINRYGIRMGTSELYRVVEEFPEVADSLVVDLEYLGRESFMALFVVLRDGSRAVPPELKGRLLDAIRVKLSARHVPNDVFAIAEVPRTISGKKMEVPVKKILLGHPAEKSANRDSMANPASIDWFIAFATSRESQR